MIGTDIKNGKRISGNTHLRQSIIDILSTPIGSRVLRRDYGSLLPSLLDNPQDETTRMRIMRETAGSLSRWEPRFRLSKVSVSFPALGEFFLQLEGVNLETGSPITISEVIINGTRRQY